MYFEDDDVLGGTPKSRFLDIVFHANRNVVQDELAKMVEWMAALEMIVEGCGLDVEEEVQKILFDETKQGELENKTNSLFIEYMGKILSQSE